MNILIFQHAPHESPGYISEYAIEKGITLHVLELWKPYVIPEMKGYDAFIVLGGPMGVYEDFDSREDELRVLKEQVGKLPILGICLGSQLLAHVLGAEVYKNFKDGVRAKEIGYYDIELTKEGREARLFSGIVSPFTALQWHGDTFDLPKNSALLASSPLCANQAFSYKGAYGTLFHMEFTADMVRNLMDTDRLWTHEDFAIDEKKLIAQVETLAPIMKRQCYQLLDNFLSSSRF